MSLNDPQWGRGGSSGSGSGDKPGGAADDGPSREPPREPRGQRPPPGGSGGPPDLDELWRDFNRRLNALFGRRGGGSGNGSGGGRFGSFQPDAKGAGVGILLVVLVAVVIWAATGIYIVQEGRVGVVTTFGKYSETTNPGFRWRFPWPVQDHEIVDVFTVRTVAIGSRAAGRSADRLKEALMLTDDENIVDIDFNVQYRIKDGGEGARDFIFNSRRPEESVTQAAESAMREVVGRKLMDSVLYESRQEIATEVQKRIQDMLDRYGTGIQISVVAIQNAQPPEQVQAAFDDATKANQDRERQISEGQAYANDVVPRARGIAARLIQEAEGHRTRVLETAQGDASRFRQILVEYNKAPAVTRDRMYLETMQQVFTNTTKVMVDSRSSNNLLYLPFDKLMQQAIADVNAQRPAAAEPAPPTPAAATESQRSRDALRSREGR
jgi:membrane protease subunit HflK